MSIPHDKFDEHQIIYCKKKISKGDSSIPKVIEATGNFKLIMPIIKFFFYSLPVAIHIQGTLQKDKSSL